jgi:hypothetical protein
MRGTTTLGNRNHLNITIRDHLFNSYPHMLYRAPSPSSDLILTRPTDTLIVSVISENYMNEPSLTLIRGMVKNP